MSMEAHRTLWPSDVWSAIELTAAREGMSVSDVIRVGTLSYTSYLLARRNDATTLAFDALWDSARKVVEVWPLG